MEIKKFGSKRKQPHPCYKGFTLVELLVVVSIIALLLAVLMPALTKARSQGRRIVCQHNIHTMNVALFTYNLQQGNYPAVVWNTAPGGKTYYWTERLIMAKLIDGYYDRRSKNYYISKQQYKAYTCPEYMQMTGTEYMWCSLSYAFNDYYLSPSRGEYDTDRNPTYLGNLITKPVIMLIESDHVYLGADTDFPNGLKGKPPETKNTIPKRHGGILSAGWVDGHVAFQKFESYTPVMINPKYKGR